MNKKVIHNVIDQASIDFKDRVAIQELNRQLTYGALKRHTDSIAHFLVNSGIKRGEIVAVYQNSCIEYVCSIIGTNKSGAVFMPIEPTHPFKRVSYMFKQVAPRLVLTTLAHKDGLIDLLKNEELATQVHEIVTVDIIDDKIKLEVWNGNSMSLPADDYKSEQPLDIQVDGDDSNYLLFTSGSTGYPKAIEGCHKGLSHFIHWEKTEFSLNETVRVSQLAPLSFDVSLRDIFVPLVCGGTLYIPTAEIKSDPVKLAGWIGDNGLSVMHMVPTLFRLLTEELKRNPALQTKLASLHWILLAGEALYGRDLQAWRTVAGTNAELVNMYGPSETTLAKVFNRTGTRNYEPNEIVPLGKPISNTFVIILKNDKLCEVDEIGEIHIKTPFRTKGYYKDSLLTNEKFIQNPLHNDYEDIIYKTGDLGKYLKDRSVAFMGRQDSQVKIRGNRVELFEVERVIAGFPGIKQVTVTAVKSAFGEDVLACYYTIEKAVEESAFQQYLSNWLSEYMFPSYYTELEEFPLNLNGKIDKRALPKPEELLYEKLKYEAPGNKLEKQLVSIWSEILGIKKIGVRHSFFHLGGHSLSATRVISRIYKEIGKELSVKDFFDNPTISELATFLEERQATEFKDIKPAPLQDDYPLSHAQKRLWILDQLEQEMVAYNMPVAFVFQSEVNKPALKNAFDALVKRHESLRTIFTLVNGEPRQRILTEMEFTLAEIDCSNDKNDLDVITNFVTKQVKEPFDLSKGPLLKGWLVTLSNRKHLFLFTIHHIVSDGWSMGIIMKEVLQLYKSYNENKEHLLPALHIQYKDYAAWQQEQLSHPVMNRHKNYWYNRLSSSLQLLNLPTDYTRKDSRSYSGAKYHFAIHYSDSAAVRKICDKQQVSLYMFLLSAVKILLYKFAGQHEIIIGSPIAARFQPGLENQIGFYLNNLVLKTTINKEDSFPAFLKQVKLVTLEAYEHQAYPFDRLVEDLNIQPQQNRNPIYDVIVVMNNAELNGRKKDIEEMKETLGVESILIDEQTSKLDLSFFFDDEPKIGVMIEYSTELFSVETIKRIEIYFTALIKTLIFDSTQSIQSLVSLLSPENEKRTYQGITSSTLNSISEEF